MKFDDRFNKLYTSLINEAKQSTNESVNEAKILAESDKIHTTNFIKIKMTAVATDANPANITNFLYLPSITDCVLIATVSIILLFLLLHAVLLTVYYKT